MSTLFWNYLFEVRNFFGDWIGTHIIALQVGSLVISAIFLWAILYITVKSNYWTVKREQFLDMLKIETVFKERSLNGWKQIKERIASSDPEEWKKAILEADKILNEIFKMSGYLGHRLEDKLALITSEQLANVEQVKQAHQIAHKIHGDPSYDLAFEDALAVLRIYKEAFRDLRLIDE